MSSAQRWSVYLISQTTPKLRHAQTRTVEPIMKGKIRQRYGCFRFRMRSLRAVYLRGGGGGVTCCYRLCNLCCVPHQCHIHTGIKWNLGAWIYFRGLFASFEITVARQSKADCDQRVRHVPRDWRNTSYQLHLGSVTHQTRNQPSRMLSVSVALVSTVLSYCISLSVLLLQRTQRQVRQWDGSLTLAVNKR